MSIALCMKICFYCGSGTVSPVEQYIYDKFGENLNRPNTEAVITEITHIISKWKHVADNNGIPDNQYAKKMSGFDFIEIRVKRSKTLIRFPYFRDATNDRLVLLLGFEKKEGYKKKDKTDRHVNKKLEEAQVYYGKYNKNKRLYKEMTDIFCRIYDQLNF